MCVCVRVCVTLNSTAKTSASNSLVFLLFRSVYLTGPGLRECWWMNTFQVTLSWPSFFVSLFYPLTYLFFFSLNPWCSLLPLLWMLVASGCVCVRGFKGSYGKAFAVGRASVYIFCICVSVGGHIYKGMNIAWICILECDFPFVQFVLRNESWITYVQLSNLEWIFLLWIKSHTIWGFKEGTVSEGKIWLG